MARPDSYNPEIAEGICERLVNGESLRAICLRNDMPSKGTVYRWLAKYPDFAAQYATARELQADFIFDEIIDIADDSDIDPEAGTVDREAVQRKRLRLDARKWVLAKMRPQKYGERTAADKNTDKKAIKVPELKLTIAVPKNKERTDGRD